MPAGILWFMDSQSNLKWLTLWYSILYTRRHPLDYGLLVNLKSVTHHMSLYTYCPQASSGLWTRSPIWSDRLCDFVVLMPAGIPWILDSQSNLKLTAFFYSWWPQTTPGKLDSQSNLKWLSVRLSLNYGLEAQSEVTHCGIFLFFNACTYPLDYGLMVQSELTHCVIFYFQCPQACSGQWTFNPIWSGSPCDFLFLMPAGNLWNMASQSNLKWRTMWCPILYARWHPLNYGLAVQSEVTRPTAWFFILNGIHSLHYGFQSKLK